MLKFEGEGISKINGGGSVQWAGGSSSGRDKETGAGGWATNGLAEKEPGLTISALYNWAL
jgi:hypothetical protein